MIDMTKAQELARKEAKKKGLDCFITKETDHYFLFLPITKKGEAIGNSSSYAVDKQTGKVELKHFSQLMHERTIKEY